jgi:hypothetical protein
MRCSSLDCWTVTAAREGELVRDLYVERERLRKSGKKKEKELSVSGEIECAESKTVYYDYDTS